MDTIKPFGNNILVEPVEKKQVLVSDQSPLCEYGKVISIGSDVEHIKVGDTIGFTVWGINKLEINDKKYYFIAEDARFLLGTITMSGQLAS